MRVNWAFILITTLVLLLCINNVLAAPGDTDENKAKGTPTPEQAAQTNRENLMKLYEEISPSSVKVEKGTADGNGITNANVKSNNFESTGTNMDPQDIEDCEKRNQACPECAQEPCEVAGETAQTATDPWGDWENLYDFYSGGQGTHATTAGGYISNPPWSFSGTNLYNAISSAGSFITGHADTISAAIGGLSQSPTLGALGLWNALYGDEDQTEIDAEDATNIEATPNEITIQDAEDISIGPTDLEDATNFNFDGTSASADYAETITLKPLTPGPPTHGHAESNFLSVKYAIDRYGNSRPNAIAFQDFRQESASHFRKAKFGRHHYNPGSSPD